MRIRIAYWSAAVLLVVAPARWTFRQHARVSPFFHATADLANFWRTGVGGGVQVRLDRRFEVKYQFDLSLLVAEESEELFGHLIAFVVRIPVARKP